MAIIFVLFVVGVLLCLHSAPRQQNYQMQAYRTRTQETILRETIVETPYGTEVRREVIVRRDAP